MGNSQHHPLSGDGREGEQPLRRLLKSVLGSAPSPIPDLSDEELVAEVRKASAEGGPERGSR
ncbi:hypothetical protein [Kitasatospora aureofaciens]|uniref:hypothetical protein n=1 Tax=Kitasatospora aureofaciens TaxID=1894 RepID=UPI0036F467C5